MYFDGASNIVGHGVGAVFISPDEKSFPITAKLSFNCTNNIAEYEACVMGFQAAIEKKYEVLEVYGDSALVIYQLRGEWETRDSKLVPYQKYISQLVEQFEKVKFQHLPREDNQIADALATLAAMFGAEVQPIIMGLRDSPAYCANVEEEVDGKPWYDDILQYMKHQQYPEHASENDKRLIRKLAIKT